MRLFSEKEKIRNLLEKLTSILLEYFYTFGEIEKLKVWKFVKNEEFKGILSFCFVEGLAVWMEDSLKRYRVERMSGHVKHRF